VLGRKVTHTLAFGISQAGRYLRDHIAQGSTPTRTARACSTASSPRRRHRRVFHNTPFAQPFRTRTWHEDHDFPEVEFPFRRRHRSIRSAGQWRFAARRCVGSKIIETNTSTEYWQKAHRCCTPIHSARATWCCRLTCALSAGRHAARRKAGMPRDNGPCVNPRNWHDPMPAIRAAGGVDEWV